MNIQEWIVCDTYNVFKYKSQIRINNSFRDAFNLQMGIHQGLVLNLSMFNIVLGALQLGISN